VSESTAYNIYGAPGDQDETEAGFTPGESVYGGQQPPSAYNSYGAPGNQDKDPYYGSYNGYDTHPDHEEAKMPVDHNSKAMDIADDENIYISSSWTKKFSAGLFLILALI
jgi:hypothetical protein